MSVSKLTLSDYHAIFENHKLTSFAHKQSHYTIKYRSFKTFDDNAFKHDLSQVPWEVLSTCNDVDEIVHVWNFLFLETVNKHAPLKQHRVRKPQQPDSIWLNPEILDAIKERNNCKINGNHNECILLRNKVSSMIRIAKNNVYKTKNEARKDDPRTIWKIFREFGASGKAGVRENISGTKDISDHGEIANVFNKYFANVASQLKEPIEYSDFKNIKDYIDCKVPCVKWFTVPEIPHSFVRNFLQSLDVTKATGLSYIGHRLLKIAPYILCPSITYVVNKNIISRTFPKAWKEAKVNPFFKSGSKEDVNNYRPISILPTLSKIIKK